MSDVTSDERISHLIQEWLQEILAEYRRLQIFPLDSDSPKVQEAKEAKCQRICRDISTEFYAGQIKAETAETVRQICVFEGGDEKVALLYGKEKSEINRWRNGRIAVPLKIHRAMLDKYRGKHVPLAKDVSCAFGLMASLDYVRNKILAQVDFTSLTIEVWEMMIRAWRKREWREAETANDAAALQRLFQTIRKEVHALRHVQRSIDGKASKVRFQIWNDKSLQGQLDDWLVPLRLALGALGGEV